MTGRVERRGAPSLLHPRGAPEARPHGSLLDLMHEGFYLMFMLRNGAAPPTDDAIFMQKISLFLADFDREAKKIHAEHEDVEAAKYAFCAAVDEVILSSAFPNRGEWERRPLQLVLFGDQLAGEHFFDRLEELRARGAVRLQSLQVFHMCLLLGFHGRHAVEGSDKLNYLSARLGDEIAHMKGKSRGFAPRAERPDQVVHKRRGDVPLWAASSLFALIAIGAYLGLKSSLARDTVNGMAAYADLVKLAPRPAHLTITLP